MEIPENLPAPVTSEEHLEENWYMLFWLIHSCTLKPSEIKCITKIQHANMHDLMLNEDFNKKTPLKINNQHKTKSTFTVP